MSMIAWPRTALLALTLAGAAQATPNYAGMEDDSFMLLAECARAACGQEPGWSADIASLHSNQAPWAEPEALNLAWRSASPDAAPAAPPARRAAEARPAHPAALVPTPVPTPVPEPSIYSMLLIGIGLLLFAAHGEKPEKFTQ